MIRFLGEVCATADPESLYPATPGESVEAIASSSSSSEHSPHESDDDSDFLPGEEIDVPFDEGGFPTAEDVLPLEELEAMTNRNELRRRSAAEVQNNAPAAEPQTNCVVLLSAAEARNNAAAAAERVECNNEPAANAAPGATGSSSSQPLAEVPLPSPQPVPRYRQIPAAPLFREDARAVQGGISDSPFRYVDANGMLQPIPRTPTFFGSPIPWTPPVAGSSDGAFPRVRPARLDLLPPTPQTPAAATGTRGQRVPDTPFTMPAGRRGLHDWNGSVLRPSDVLAGPPPATPAPWTPGLGFIWL